MSRDQITVVADLAKNLRQHRIRSGISQEALALAAEVDRTYVSQIERGIGNPSIKVLCRLAQILEVDLLDLLSSSQ